MRKGVDGEMSDKELQDARIDGHELRLDAIADKIKVLEKKLVEHGHHPLTNSDWEQFKASYESWRNSHTEQIAELRDMHEKDLNQVLDDVKTRTCNALLSHMNVLGRPDEHGIGTIKEVLRDSIEFSNLLLELFLNADIID